jgi:proline iminopeptidase
MKRLLYILIILFVAGTANGQDKSFFFTTSDSVKLYVHTAGTGKPCLFVHGGPGYTSYIFEATPAAKMIEQKMHMIYYDQRGSGRSAAAASGHYSMKRMERDIEELRAFLKIKKWSVMGHSFAGVIITAYAKDCPQYINSMVYMHCMLDLNSSLRSHIDNGTRLLKELGDNYKADTSLSKFDQMMNVHKELAKQGIEYKIMFRSQRDKNVEDSLANASTKNFNQDFQHHVWGIKEYWFNYITYTNDITCPVLIITGTKDYAVGPDSYKAWHFPNSKVVIYDGAHTSYQEEPKWFVDRVLPFLEK